MGRPPQHRVIPAPDITKLAKGIYGPQMEALKQEASSARGQVTSLNKKIKALQKALVGMTNDRNAKLQDLANSKESNRKLRIENADLKCELKKLRESHGGSEQEQSG